MSEERRGREGGREEGGSERGEGGRHYCVYSKLCTIQSPLVGMWVCELATPYQ